jgi:NADPH:quinone reductase-like Zn-dependent oxidoreductase
MLRSLGADRVVDYAREDVTAGPDTYDVIFDIVRDTPSGGMVRMLAPNGCLLMANPGFRQIVRAKWAAKGTGKRVSISGSGTTTDDLVHLRTLLEAGRLHPVIDRQFPFDQLVEAHRYAESGQKQGNVVVIVA